MARRRRDGRARLRRPAGGFRHCPHGASSCVRAESRAPRQRPAGRLRRRRGRGCRMARSPRYLVEGQPHHVIQRGQQPLASLRVRGRLPVLRALPRGDLPTHGVAIHAHVLMTNHVHLLVTPAETTERAESHARRSASPLTCALPTPSHQRTGTLLEGRCRSTLRRHRAVIPDVHALHRVQSAVRAGMVTRPEEYRSVQLLSANALGSDADLSLAPHQVYLELGAYSAGAESAYRQLFRDPLPPTGHRGHPCAQPIGPGWSTTARQRTLGSRPGSDPGASVG